MISSAEQIQTNYEISMAIGTSLDLKKMLRYSLTTIMRKFNCPVAEVFLVQEQDNHLCNFNRIFSIPRQITNANITKKLSQVLMQNFPLEELESVLSNTPTEINVDDNTRIYLFSLPGLGLLSLVKKNEILSAELVNAFKPLLNKLSLACKSCLQNEELLKHQNNLSELVTEQTNELRQQKRALEENNIELHELNRTKNKFFSIIAHDLRSPFNSIMGLTSLMKENYSEMTSDEIFTYITLLNDEATTSFKLLENLLEWSRIQSGRIEFSPEYFDLSDLIESNIGLFAQAASRKGISLQMAAEEKSVLIKADKQMINTVLRNLLSNAIKFTEANGEVCVATKLHPKFVEIKVKDSGVGLGTKQLENLFKIEETASTPGTNRETGSGLGLVLCKEFIDMHKGLIDVYSECAKGTEVCVKLPV